MAVFNPSDLFAVGLGFDISGGYLVARGLFLDEADMAALRTWAGTGAGAQPTVARARDRVDGTFGLFFLGLGFVLQAVGYLTQEAGVGHGRTGLCPALVFVGLALAAVLGALRLHRWLAPGRVKALALRVLLLDGEGVPRDRPSGPEIMDLGVEFGDDAKEGETFGQYAQRVWGLEDVGDADSVPTEAERRRRQQGRKPLF